MGAEGTRRSMAPKVSEGKFFSTLHPNTILTPYPDARPYA